MGEFDYNSFKLDYKPCIRRKDMIRRITLIADDGMRLTNGKQFLKVTHLAVGADESEWNEITEEEYNRILAEEEEKNNNQ